MKSAKKFSHDISDNVYINIVTAFPQIHPGTTHYPPIHVLHATYNVPT